MTNRDPDKPVRRALCCECGQLRTVGRNAPLSVKDRVTAGMSPQLLRRMMPGDRWSGIEPYWRWVAPFMCANCGTRRRHALLRDDEHADWEELGVMPGYP
jgi:hypothetical protein